MKIYFIVMVLFSISLLLARQAFVPSVRRLLDGRTWLVFAILIGAGMLLQPSILFFPLALVVTAVSSRSRVDAAARLALLSAVIPDAGYYWAIGSAYILSLSPMIMLALGTLIACIVHPGRTVPVRRTVEDVFVLVIGCIMFRFTLTEVNPTVVLRNLASMILEFGVPYYVFSRFVTTRDEFRVVLGALAAGGIILGFFAIYEARYQWSTFFSFYDNISNVELRSHSLKVRAGLMRTPVTFAESTSFAVFQMTGLMAAVACRSVFRSRFLWLAGIGVILLGLLAAQSRGADLAVVVGLMVLMLARRRYMMAGTIAGGGAVLVGLLLVLARSIPRLADALGTDNHGMAGSDTDYRQSLLRRGIEEGMRHPWIGDNMTNVYHRLEDLRQGEGIIDLVNTYLTIFLCSGIIGLTAFTAMLLAVVARCWKSTRKQRSDRGFVELHGFTVAALCAWAFAMAFTAFAERNPLWLLIIVAAVPLLRSKAAGSTLPARPTRLPENAVAPLMASAEPANA